ncbi:MAG: CHAD domain-containing protein [Dehalococcoidia bacterium]
MSRASSPVEAAPADLEVEWQFDAADLDAVERWLWAPPATLEARVIARGEQRLEDTYYDTADRMVARAGFTLRLRRRAARDPEVTLKATTAAPAGNGPRMRTELSATAKRGFEERDAIEGRCGEVLRALVGTKHLEPLFEVHTARRVFDVTLADETAIEVALDRTRVCHDRREVQIARVELELTGGTHETAEAFAKALRRALELKPAGWSKFGAGAALARLDPPEAVLESLVPGPRTFRRRATAHEAARAALRGQLAALLTHEPAARLGVDPEGVHQMRVATRRLRAGIRLFRDALPPDWSEARQELRWLAGALGVVRDLDVQLESLEAWARDAEADPEEHTARVEVVRHLETRRTEARDALLAALDSPRYTALVEALTSHLRPRPRRPALRLRVRMRVPPEVRRDARRIAEALGAFVAAADGPRARDDVRRFGRRELRKAHRGFARPARALHPDARPEAYHAVRIKAKRLRYAAEFLAPLYGRDGKRFIEAMKELQDRLGDHQDAYVAEAQLRTLAEEATALPPRAIFSMGELAAERRDGAVRLRRGVPRDLRRVDRRWRKLRRRARRLAR